MSEINENLNLEVTDPVTQNLDLEAEEAQDVPAIILNLDMQDGASVKSAEAWAVGQRGGVDVPSTDVTYHNNAKYYSEETAAAIDDIVVVQDATPTAQKTKVWMPATAPSGVQVPTYAEHQAVEATLAKVTPTNTGTQGQILRNNGQGGAVWTDAATAEEVATAAEAWLNDHVSQGETLAIDNTLTLSGYAGDAKVTGDKISELKSALSDKNNIIIPSENLVEAIDNDLYTLVSSSATYVQGGRNNSGEAIASSIRIRTTLLTTSLTLRYKIVPKTGYKVNVCYYTGNNTDTFIGHTGYFTKPYITNYGLCISILVGKTDDSNIVPADAPNALDTYRLVPIVDELDERLDAVEKTKEQTDLLDIMNAEPIPYAIGSTSAFIRADTGATANGSNYERTDFVDVSGYNYIVYSRVMLTSDSTTGGTAFYTSNSADTFISDSGDFCGLNASVLSYEERIIHIPPTAKYARFTLNKTISGFYVKGIKKNVLNGLKLSLLGASIETFTGYVPEGNHVYYTGSNAGVKSVNEIWWKVLCNNTGMIPLVIDAWSGSAVCYNYATDSTHSDTNKIPMCSDLRTGRLASNGVNPDIIIVAGGTNDWTYSKSSTTPLGDWNGRTAVDRNAVVSGQSTFMESFASMVDKLHENYPSAIVVCLSMFYTCRGTDLGCTRVNDMGYTESDYSDAVEKVCKIMGVPYIDIYDVGFNFDNYYPTYSIDSSTEATHPNALGHAVIAKRIIDKLPKLVRQFKG